MKLLFPLIIIKNNGNNNASRMINDIMTSHQVTHFGNLLRTTPSSPLTLLFMVASPTSSMESRAGIAPYTEMRGMILRFTEWKLEGLDGMSVIACYVIGTFPG